MMNLKQLKRYHARDFAWRKRVDPGSVTPAGNYGEYVHIHPFVDEVIEEGAEGIAMCHKVDAWWKSQGMMVFLQVSSAFVWRECEPGYYAGWDRDHGRALLKLIAIVDEPLIYRAGFHEVLREFSRFGVFHPRIYKRLWRMPGFVRLPMEN